MTYRLICRPSPNRSPHQLPLSTQSPASRSRPLPPSCHEANGPAKLSPHARRALPRDCSPSSNLSGPVLSAHARLWCTFQIANQSGASSLMRNPGFNRADCAGSMNFALPVASRRSFGDRRSRPAFALRDGGAFRPVASHGSASVYVVDRHAGRAHSVAGPEISGHAGTSPGPRWAIAIRPLRFFFKENTWETGVRVSTRMSALPRSEHC
jgi:hypothetical protein